MRIRSQRLATWLLKNHVESEAPGDQIEYSDCSSLASFRECEKRNNKRPGLLDLRDSGAIEQNADIVIFLYREVVYKPSVHPSDVAELIVDKHRNGPTRTLYVGFNASTGTFWDLESGYVPQYTSDEEDDFSPQKKKRQRGSTAAAHNSMES